MLRVVLADDENKVLLLLQKLKITPDRGRAEIQLPAQIGDGYLLPLLDELQDLLLSGC